MRHTDVLVLGGSGFIGRYVVNLLVARGCRVLVPARRRDKAKHLILLPTCDVVEADIHDDATLDRLLAGRDAVINLVGILHGAAADFDRVHAELPRRLIAACAKHRVSRLLHISALGASPDAPSLYLRSKAAGEAHVRGSPLAWTIFRPSVVFGAEDRFLNLFAKLARWFPVLPIGGANARFQPVWVQDVARAIANSLDNEATYRKTYELAGPRIYTLRELVAFAARAAGHPRPVIALPDSLARLQARLMELLPGEPLLSRDNLDSMKVDNVASEQPYRPAPELGIRATPMEPEAALYLAGLNPRARLAMLRARARR
ncbi:MAG TPA: complex I NDUFA9 subunit family protein [Burkholderiaceae bacterium]|jgi:NADH dehydrogenase|nr:complex I NDUFA9 subunit family protein [Burkholderiaceae bacterium]